MATETLIGNGIRQNFLTLGDRNFEDSGTVQYACRKEGMQFNAVNYHVGDHLPFDASGNTVYSRSAIEQLRFAWNQGWCVPLS